MSEWIRGLLEQIGKPIPCGGCGEPRLRDQLEEVWVPRVQAFGDTPTVGPITVDRLEWWCAPCREAMPQ